MNAAHDPTRLSAQRASVFLKLAISGPRRPIDDLIDALRKDSSGRLLIDLLESGPLRGFGSAKELLLDGRVSLETCAEIKERSKVIVAHAGTADERLAGIAGYFISLATALQFHHVLLSARDQHELATVFLDLADACPEQYATLLSNAAAVHLKRVDGSASPADEAECR